MHIQNQLVKAQEEEKSISELLGNLQSSLKDLKAEQAVVNHELARKDKEAVNARKKVETLQNPFTPRNLLQWLLDHGGQIVGIILAIIVLRWLVVVFSGRIVSLIMKSRKRSSEREAENRAFTLSGVFRHLCSVMIIGGGTIMLLDTVGIPIGPLMGGAAVLGLAIAFGAQNLIRDYFSGFMVLMEDQYGVNDIIRIGDTAGRVERLSLRTTVLRDVEGVVHFVPHGTIKTVSNLTHGWSRAFFEIGIAYKENVDAVMKILIELGTELRQDPKYAGYILDDPEMLGVDSFDSSAVVLKFFIKTRPLQQWVVKRELLRRIKNRFDELGVEIPFPHRTVYHRYSEGTSIPAPHTSQDSDQERTAA